MQEDKYVIRMKGTSMFVKPSVNDVVGYTWVDWGKHPGACISMFTFDEADVMAHRIPSYMDLEVCLYVPSGKGGWPDITVKKTVPSTYKRNNEEDATRVQVPGFIPREPPSEEEDDEMEDGESGAGVFLIGCLAVPIGIVIIVAVVLKLVWEIFTW